ncbi:hypothetical protein [Candidatus Venteria ishoeyi]|uniref:Uncharacterized protein n=1 Tax=Candidatus Venteria ishoeyi TaxID=1899563 RepID=A0A1H6F678_9GAMM|nr:hypothetical protein [Candidatus Venteria ishoeyi]SEH04881.1 Uncharacterised protein [Candidatus Venteria ishoeyi]
MKFKIKKIILFFLIGGLNSQMVSAGPFEDGYAAGQSSCQAVTYPAVTDYYQEEYNESYRAGLTNCSTRPPHH